MEQSQVMKIYNECNYIDLEAENAHKMLSKCINTVLETYEDSPTIIEGFQDNCCPDGHTFSNDKCQKVCINCKYNDCDKGSGNRGTLYDYTLHDKKGIKNKKMDDDIFTYIFTS
tara:strand:+ start:254 stop:595 length:342 start_codon:yes stop_codon:yes gene_type:complete